MELRQLEYFVAVVEEQSFTRAAQRVHVAQPGISAQIRRLEQELGQTLLDRSPRGVYVTAAGAAVLPHARAALKAVGAVGQTIDQLAGLLRGRVAVGMLVNCPAGRLADLLAAFHRDHPGVELSLREDNSDVLIDDLRDGSLDLAVLAYAGRDPDGLALQVLTDDALVAGVAAGHELAGRKRISVTSLAAHGLIALPRGTGLRTALETACTSAGVRPRIALEAGDPEVLIELAARGLGVAILAESMVTDLHTIAITGPQPRGRVALAWRADGPASSAAQALIDRAQTAITSLR